MSMENNPAEMLMNEHEIIQQVESIIHSMDGLWEHDPEKYRAMVSKLVYFFREYSDVFHHRKEEDILFPELVNHPDFLLNEIIVELEEHHEMFREYTQDIEDLIESDELVKAHLLLTKYVNDLLDHIAVENDELFSIAENLFTESQLENMYFRFKDIDLELGEDLKSELEKIPQDLKDKLSENAN